MKTFATFLYAVLICCASVQLVSAADREGILIGFSIGGGSLDCGECAGRSATAIDLRLGRSVAKRVAVQASFGGLFREEASFAFSSYSLTGIAQYWVTSRLWAGGGVGFGENSIDVGRTSNYSGNSLALAATTGVELWRRGSFALDLRGRYDRLTKFQTDNVSIAVGFTWY